jgi:hypothetical protein
LAALSLEQFVKWYKGNDIWALAVIQQDTVQPVVPTPSAISQVLDDFPDVFETPTNLPPHRDHDHSIPLLPGLVLVNSRPYHYSPLHKYEIERQVKALLESSLISISTSPFSSRVLLVQKKDGTWRFCADYRRLNSITIKNKFPMPLIKEILDELTGSCYFTRPDFKSGFQQIRMQHEDEYKTVFKTHHDHYQFRVMSFGLTNAPATF